MVKRLTKSFLLRTTEEEAEQLQKASENNGMSKNELCRIILFYQPLKFIEESSNE